MTISGAIDTHGVHLDWTLRATPTGVRGRLTTTHLQLEAQMDIIARITVDSVPRSAGFLVSFAQIIHRDSYRVWYYRSTDSAHQRFRLERFPADCLDGDHRLDFPWYEMPRAVNRSPLDLAFRDHPLNHAPLANDHGDRLVKTGGRNHFSVYLGLWDGEEFSVLGSLGWSIDWKSNIDHHRREIRSLQPVTVAETDQDVDRLNEVDQTRRANDEATRRAETGRWG